MNASPSPSFDSASSRCPIHPNVVLRSRLTRVVRSQCLECCVEERSSLREFGDLVVETSAARSDRHRGPLRDVPTRQGRTPARRFAPPLRHRGRSLDATTNRSEMAPILCLPCSTHDGGNDRPSNDVQREVRGQVGFKVKGKMSRATARRSQRQGPTRKPDPPSSPAPRCDAPAVMRRRQSSNKSNAPSALAIPDAPKVLSEQIAQPTNGERADENRPQKPHDGTARLSPAIVIKYEVGQRLLDPAHSLPFTSASVASILLSKLPPGSPLFVKRTSREWTYAMLASKTANEDGDIASLVVILEGGRKKELGRSKWERCLRLVRGPPTAPFGVSFDTRTDNSPSIPPSDAAKNDGSSFRRLSSTPEQLQLQGRRSGNSVKSVSFDRVDTKTGKTVDSSTPIDRKFRSCGAAAPGDATTISSSTVYSSNSSHLPSNSKSARFHCDTFTTGVGSVMEKVIMYPPSLAMNSSHRKTAIRLRRSASADSIASKHSTGPTSAESRAFGTAVGDPASGQPETAGSSPVATDDTRLSNQNPARSVTAQSPSTTGDSPRPEIAVPVVPTGPAATAYRSLSPSTVAVNLNARHFCGSRRDRMRPQRTARRGDSASRSLSLSRLSSLDGPCSRGMPSDLTCGSGGSGSSTVALSNAACWGSSTFV